MRIHPEVGQIAEYGAGCPERSSCEVSQTPRVGIPEKGVLKQVQVRKTRTFDSSPTRKRGHSSRTPKTFADVNLDAISGQIAATIERAKATDPRELTRRIRELEKALATRAATPGQPEPEVIEVPVLNEALVTRLEAVTTTLSHTRATTDTALAGLLQHIQQTVEEYRDQTRQMAEVGEAITSALATAQPSSPTRASTRPTKSQPPPKPPTNPGLLTPRMDFTRAVTWTPIKPSPGPNSGLS